MIEDKKFSIRLRNAGLTEVNGEVIAQGFLDVEAVNQLKVGDYQREVLKPTGEKISRRSALERAIESGTRLPTIVLGMRGQNFRSSGDDLLLYDPTYIVDGLQRTAAMKAFADAQPDRAKGLLMGCEVRFGTSYETEKELFHTLNTKRMPMSPNVILRNTKDHNKAVLTIYGLSVSDSTSPIFDRVQWSQRRTRGQLFTALSVARAMEMLHKHISVPIYRSVGSPIGRNSQAASMLDRKAQAIGLKAFRENAVEYFDVVDQAFGLRAIEYGELSPHLRTNFLITLARLLSDHEDFWSGNRLVVSAAQKRKLATFHIDDPTVIKLCGGSNTTLPMLYGLLVNHMNYRVPQKNHLKARKVSVSKDMDQLEAAE